MRIDSSGNVGIGIDDPLSKLHISGQSGTTGLPSLLLYGESPATGQRYGFNVSADQLDISALGTNAGIGFYTGGNASSITQRMRIDSSGIVSITNESSDGLIIERTGTTTGKYRFGIGGTNLLTIRDVAQSQTRMAINSSGNVGINQTNPTSGKLEVQQTATTAALWVQTGGTTSSYTIADFRTGTNASALNIKGDGVVGIGTDFVSARLQVHSTNAGQPTIPLFIVNESTTIGTEARLGFAANTNNDVGTNRYSYISTKNTSGSNGQAMIFATNETGASAVERMRITSGGNVGIGTGGYAQKPLDVSGATGGQLLITGANDAVGTTAGILLRAEGGESNGLARIKGGIFFERIAGTYGNGDLKFAINTSVNNDAVTVADTKNDYRQFWKT